MVSRRERRERRLLGKFGEAQPFRSEPAPVQHAPRRTNRSLFHRIYDDHYKVLLIIPLLLIVFSIGQIAYQISTTGDFLNKGVSLKGGLTITVPVHEKTVDLQEIRSAVAQRYPDNDVVVRDISELGVVKGITIEATEESTETSAVQALERGIVDEAVRFIPTARQEYSVEVVGPSLGEAFFSQTIKAVIIAFLLMGMVLYYYFGEGLWLKTLITVLSLLTSYVIFQASSVVADITAAVLIAVLIFLYVRHSAPSFMVILCAFSEIIGTLAIVNVLGVKISTAGIAAFLMLLGYSVDTDILLSTRVLKHTHGTIYERTVESMKTGMTMSLASMAAAGVGYLVAQSSTIREIMLIIFIGLILDTIFTWIQNAGMLRWYLEHRSGAHRG